MRPKVIIPIIFLTILLLLISFIIEAKSMKLGSIIGTLTDLDSGKPIAGATVIIEGTSLSATTDKNGRFEIKGVHPGQYNLNITHKNYDSITISAVSVNISQPTEITYQLSSKKIERDKVDKEIIDLKESKIGIPVPVADQTAEAIKQKPMSFSGAVISHELKRGKRAGCSQDNNWGYAPAHGGNAIVNGEPFDAMFFKNYGVNPFVDTDDDHFSTFAIDVDDAAFIMTRSYLNRGALPPEEAIRTEEFINHFKYNYAAPGEEPFKIYIDGALSRFGQNCSMLRVGIKGMEISPENRKDANLVFVVDVSGSMGTENRLGLVRQALRLLLDELNENDKVGIVVYGSSGKIVLEPTSLRDKQRIISAIESLYPSGATNAEEGLMLGYDMAKRQFEKGKINRIILCSDGVANVGRTGPDAILKQIKEYAEMGITLSTVGFGMNNYNDILMEKLGNKGNGHYAYVDNLTEAKKIFVDNLTGNLQVIARDVKIQVDFNPDVVRSYRLLGYENRDVDDDKFRDDKEDGGEIGAGHQVTALYEIKFKKDVSADLIGTIYVRYKDPDTKEVSEVNRAISKSVMSDTFEQASFGFKLASCSAEFAEILRKSYWAKGSKLDDVLTLAQELSGESSSPDLIELMGLISKAQLYEEQRAEK